jgi:hypothetical protein
MRGNFLKGVLVDAVSPIPAAVFNIRWLMRWLMIFWRRILSPDLRLLDQHGSVVVLNVMLMSA